MLFQHLLNELAKLFGKKRTYIGFGAFLIAQNAVLLIMHFTHWEARLQKVLEGNGFPALDYVSALTMAVFMLIPQVALLMPLYTSLVGGDLVAKEAEDGTLRMILSRPISRFQLLLVKWLAGMIFCAVLVVGLSATALLFARFWFPWRNMFVWVPELNVFSVLTATQGLKFYFLSLGFMVLNAGSMFGLGFMFSCYNIKPASATILALSFLFLNFVLQSIPFFERFQEWFLVYHFRIWIFIYSDPVPWTRMIESTCVLVAFALTTFLIGAAGFQARDIKS